jgi:hypothetical protein
MNAGTFVRGEDSDWRKGSIVRLPFSVKSIFELFFDFAFREFQLYATPSLYQWTHPLPQSPFFRNLLCTPLPRTTLLVVRSPLSFHRLGI